MRIKSQITALGTFSTEFSKEQISNEPMFYRATREFALEHDGPLTKEFLSNLPEDWSDCPITIDSRSHMLMNGWYPCIPGYHHDSVIRSREDGQPNYDDEENKALHLMGLVNGEICPTEFALGEIDLDIPPIGKVIYKEWHPLVEMYIDEGYLKRVKAASGVYIEFDHLAFHQGTGAKRSGWLWFIRLTKGIPRVLEPKNEIRKQVQVYLEHPMEGW